jgi:hypothetical protein
MSSQKIRRFLLCVVAAVAACDSGGGGGGVPGNGGGSAPPLFRGISQESPEGIWEGTLTSTVTSEIFGILGVITESGETRLITDDGSQLFGTVSGSGSAVSGVLTGVTALGFAWLDASVVSNFSISGTVAERSTFSGSYSGGGDSGTFSLAYNPIYERASSLADIEGMWVALDSLLNTEATFTVDANGAINGNDIDGCIYSGLVSIVDPQFNAYGLTVSVANCMGGSVLLNGSFDGLGILSDEVSGSGQNDVLTAGISGPDLVITLQLSKI